MTTNFESLQNHFLIAMPQLNDPNFHQTVTYICEHSSEGAMGITINRPSQVSFTALTDYLNIKINDAKRSELIDTQICSGGPVEPERGFILHSTDKNWQNTLPVSEDLALSAAFEVIQDIAHGEGPTSFLISLGCAGWEAGQLEEEIADNAWLVCEANLDVLFNTPSELRFAAATDVLGIDMNFLSPDVGHC
ncbi:YqgE/AlgH family protein [Marinomonas agarivorans]|nr:YqgE/AlgH family protein [Marinomonas agarivorans]